MTIQLCIKCSDRFTANLVDDTGKKIGDYEGYVPDWMPEEHYGDYVMLDIDTITGQIKNWKNPSANTIRKTFQKKS